jgi:hypothetical protein
MKRFAIGVVAAALVCVLAGTTQAQAASPLVGAWHADGVVYGKQVSMRLDLASDGHFALRIADRSGNIVREVEGAYTYNFGTLLLYESDGELYATCNVWWANNDHFVVNGNQHWYRASK